MNYEIIYFPWSIQFSSLRRLSTGPTLIYNEASFDVFFFNRRFFQIFINVPIANLIPQSATFHSSQKPHLSGLRTLFVFPKKCLRFTIRTFGLTSPHQLLLVFHNLFQLFSAFSSFDAFRCFLSLYEITKHL